MIQNNAMLVQLTISQWTGQRHDKSASLEIEKQHQATRAGRFNKALVDKSELATMAKIAGAAREDHYKMTLPWGDDGNRMLPAKLYFDYMAMMRKHRTDFDLAADDFAVRYPTLVQTERKRLGTMYNPLDYPSSIRERFSINTVMSPVPDAKDFRVDVAEETLVELQASVTKLVEDRQKEAVKEVWTRAREVVSKINERLSDPKAVFRDTLIENARDLVKILPGLNVTGDPELANMTAEINSMLVAPNKLRAQKGLRADTASKASAILAKMPW